MSLNGMFEHISRFSLFKKKPLSAETNAWAFDQGPGAAAISTKRVMVQGLPVLQVEHYADDASWAFTCGTTDDESDGMVVSMESVVATDPSLQTIADLPVGWCAWRSSLTAPWQRGPADES